MKLFHRNCRTQTLLITPTLIVLLLLTVQVGPAVATPVTWSLDGVSFASGGGATGWFTFDLASTVNGGVTDWNITALTYTPPPPDLPIINPATFKLIVPDSPISSASYNPSGAGFVHWLTSDYLYVMSLNFTDLPTSQGPIILSQTSNYFILGDTFGNFPFIRDYVTTGELIRSVPEPSTILLLIPGLAGLCVLGRKKRG